jgi:hypothetical protein
LVLLRLRIGIRNSVAAATAMLFPVPAVLLPNPQSEIRNAFAGCRFSPSALGEFPLSLGAGAIDSNARKERH